MLGTLCYKILVAKGFGRLAFPTSSVDQDESCMLFGPKFCWGDGRCSRTSRVFVSQEMSDFESIILSDFLRRSSSAISSTQKIQLKEASGSMGFDLLGLFLRGTESIYGG